MSDAGALDGYARDLVAGARGEAAALAMRVVLAVARATGARRLRRVESAHVDGCLYHGRAGLDFARRLVELGGRVAVRTTLNVGSLDLRDPTTVRADPGLRSAGRALMEAYVALGCEQTWTCAPYQISHRPPAGAHVAWAESNAIAFVNSVLGARTDRYGDFIDIASAITGLVPDTGLHTDAGRRPALVLDCAGVPAAMWDSDAAWAALGVVLGEVAGTRVAALTGLPGDRADGGRTEDRLKAMAATAASAGGVALFHVVGVTPEAPDLDAVLRLGIPADPAPCAPAAARVAALPVTAAMLRAARDRLTTATGPALDAVSLGTPHFSVTEFVALATELAGGPPFDPAVDVYVSTSRAVLAEAERLGYVEPLRAAGGRIVTDTCTYVTPVLDPSVRTVMTNSGKWAWYAPGNLGIDVVLGTMADCLASARAGRVVRDELAWYSGPEPDGAITPDPAHPVEVRDAGGRRGSGRPERVAVPCTVLHPGEGSGELLVLDEPLSFWGGRVRRRHDHRSAPPAVRRLADRPGRGDDGWPGFVVVLLGAGRTDPGGHRAGGDRAGRAGHHPAAGRGGGGRTVRTLPACAGHLGARGAAADRAGAHRRPLAPAPGQRERHR